MAWYDVFTKNSAAGVTSETAKAVTSSIFDGVDKIIRDFKPPPEVVLQYEQAKAAAVQQVQMAMLQDIASARQMQIAIRSKWPGILSFINIGGFLFMTTIQLYVFLFHPELAATLSSASWNMIGNLNGYLASEAKLANSYWLGSSAGQDVMINQQQQPTQGDAK